MTSEARYDIVAIGNAIVDVIAQADDVFLEEEQLNKGAMTLIDADRAKQLYNDMGTAREVSGGSAANTLAGASTLGRQCALIAQVADDQLGEVFSHDIRATGIDFDVPPIGKQPPTGRCLILVTPDAQRTMNTFLGASQFLSPASVDTALIASGAILYLEGYLWDAAEPKAAMAQAIDIAHENGRKVAFTLSDGFCVERHRDDFIALIQDGKLDILFANEAEIKSLCETEDFEAAVEQTAKQIETLIVTRSEKGAIAVHQGESCAVDAEPVEKVIDTTGAGDLFAAGFLSGYIEQRPIPDCLTIGAIAAAEVISHYGARPEADLTALVKQRLG
ncbi:adenosine kinase [Parasphingorhabdus sp.]|uniref:adenosine kinase n=1 Tax=Parasphingorhabdus sp. TaxID=2709688 RepID=UPI002F95137D